MAHVQTLARRVEAIARKCGWCRLELGVLVGYINVDTRHGEPGRGTIAKGKERPKRKELWERRCLRHGYRGYMYVI